MRILRKKNTKVGWVIGISYLLILLAILVGWVLNIVNIFKSDFDLDGVLILQVVGIFIAPLGAVMGYLI